VASYQRALKGDPSRVDVYFLSARTVNESQGLKQAVPWYEKSAAAEPNNPMPHRYIGYWHKERGNRAQAIQEFRKYLALRPDADDKKDVEREIEDLSVKQ
jgi:tetratricopeptide (TPR) repeat protein